MSSTDSELGEMVAEWCASVAPQGEDSLFAIEAVVEGTSATVASGGFDEIALRSSGCLQDMLLSALTFDLEQQGVINLSAPIGEELHELNHGSRPGEEVRLADLLCHASGLRSPDTEQMDGVYSGFLPLCQYLTAHPQRFPPGSVIDYDILERILLVEYLRRRTSTNPYRLIEEGYLRGLSAEFRPSASYPELGLESLWMNPASLRTLIERLLNERDGWFERARMPASPGSIRIFDQHALPKDFVPLVNSWGILGFGNFLWGQNGAAGSSFVGTRFDEDREILLVGAFGNKYERDLILNEVCDRLGYSIGEGPRSRRIGFLNGFSAERLCGAYDGANRGRLDICLDNKELVFSSRLQNFEIRCRVGDDGFLTSRFPWPALWLQPFVHPETGADCMTIGQMTSVRI